MVNLIYAIYEKLKLISCQIQLHKRAILPKVSINRIFVCFLMTCAFLNSCTSTSSTLTTPTSSSPSIQLPSNPCKKYFNNVNYDGNKLIDCENKVIRDDQQLVAKLENDILRENPSAIQPIIDKWQALETTLKNADILPSPGGEASPYDAFTFEQWELSFVETELVFWEQVQQPPQL